MRGAVWYLWVLLNHISLHLQCEFHGIRRLELGFPVLVCFLHLTELVLQVDELRAWLHRHRHVKVEYGAIPAVTER